MEERDSTPVRLELAAPRRKQGHKVRNGEGTIVPSQTDDCTRGRVRSQDKSKRPRTFRVHGLWKSTLLFPLADSDLARFHLLRFRKSNGKTPRIDPSRNL